jgi:hypothetical protein
MRQHCNRKENIDQQESKKTDGITVRKVPVQQVEVYRTGKSGLVGMLKNEYK